TVIFNWRAGGVSHRWLSPPARHKSQSFPTICSMSATLSKFASSLSAETAFDVLAVAKRLKSHGKDVIELQIGDSPFASPQHALKAGVEAIELQQTHYCPSAGLPLFREAVAANYSREFGIPISAENVVIGPGAKVFEQFFCEAFLDPGDAVLV